MRTKGCRVVLLAGLVAVVALPFAAGRMLLSFFPDDWDWLGPHIASLLLVLAANFLLMLLQILKEVRRSEEELR